MALTPELCLPRKKDFNAKTQRRKGAKNFRFGHPQFKHRFFSSSCVLALNSLFLLTSKQSGSPILSKMYFVFLPLSVFAPLGLCVKFPHPPF
jgi:hypothetical protein